MPRARPPRPSFDEHGADIGGVIPTLILVGFVLGRWWKVVIPAAAVAWPGLLVASGARFDTQGEPGRQLGDDSVLPQSESDVALTASTMP